MRYLLDTNAVVAFVGRTSTQYLERFLSTSVEEMCLSSLVVHELAFGAYKSQKIDYNLLTLQMLLRDLTVVDFDTNDAYEAGEIRADLARKGTPIGPYDTLIAGQTRVRGLCLVTNNTREFERVAGLRIEDWTV